MVKVETSTKYLVDCANPACKGSFDVSRHFLLTPASAERRTDWHTTCEDCGYENLFTNSYKDDGEKRWTTDITNVLGKQKKKDGLVLLEFFANHKLKPEDRMFIILSTSIYDFGEGFDTDKTYYYNDHTCPTNWMRGEVAFLIQNGDYDPHGVFQFVACKSLEDLKEQYPAELAEYDVRENGLMGLSGMEFHSMFMNSVEHEAFFAKEIEARMQPEISSNPADDLNPIDPIGITTITITGKLH